MTTTNCRCMYVSTVDRWAAAAVDTAVMKAENCLTDGASCCSMCYDGVGTMLMKRRLMFMSVMVTTDGWRWHLGSWKRGRVRVMIWRTLTIKDGDGWLTFRRGEDNCRTATAEDDDFDVGLSVSKATVEALLVCRRMNRYADGDSVVSSTAMFRYHVFNVAGRLYFYIFVCNSPVIIKLKSSKFSGVCRFMRRSLRCVHSPAQTSYRNIPHCGHLIPQCSSVWKNRTI